MARFPYLSREELAPHQQHIYDRIASKRGEVFRPFSVLLNNPEAADRVAAVGEYVRYDSLMDPVVREIATLTTAREMNSQYEWTRHELLARKAGVRDAVIEAIRDGTAPKGLLPKEGVFVQYALELLRTGRPKDATFQAVVHLLGEQGTIDLTVLIGYYTMLARIISALDVELEEELTPLLPE